MKVHETPEGTSMRSLPTDTNEIRVAAEVLLELDQLAPGVRGYTVERDGALYVPLIEAEQPGNGDVGRYLDALPRDRTVKVPAVINGILRGMLVRRGFKPCMEWADYMQEWCEVYIRERVPVQNSKKGLPSPVVEPKKAEGV